MEDILAEYPLPESLKDYTSEVEQLKTESQKYHSDLNALQTIFSCIDLTTLSVDDSTDSVTEFIEKVNNFNSQFPDFQNVGGICLNPVFAPVLCSKLKVEGIKKAVVAGSFPLSQTFTDIKRMEVQKAIDFGVDEVDIVISVGEFLAGNFEFVAHEIAEIKQTCGNKRLKVILEVGALKSAENIWLASILAMTSGADIIKTSTGKNCSGATMEAVFIMCQAIKCYVAKTNRPVGIKPAGGISTIEDACGYYTIVKNILGNDYLCPKYFRIGASRLGNVLLKAMIEIKTGKTLDIKYF